LAKGISSGADFLVQKYHKGSIPGSLLLSDTQEAADIKEINK
jgi:hypothetical protein